jgi:hypothetical protein
MDDKKVLEMGKTLFVHESAHVPAEAYKLLQNPNPRLLVILS